ncbi:OmpH family outer membrane protein [Dysgonomonas sp. 521]|uniref:OmpH family outer membrane protein n=1 Tax=Dysgonomonas sp. 521 TaxID=2302932 RepID=UPI0013D71170|nr:OmpH family outer membrane protein [Dysgonomonas sp. 521]NDV94475.1 OmpH family outer membrane protein [Dysgonomonas sp. 521]
MKKQIVLLIILLFSVNALFSQTVQETGLLPIAYVDIDSLVTKYNFAKSENNALMEKYNSSNTALAQKQQRFETEIAVFQKRINDNAFLTVERAEAEAERLRKMETDLQTESLKVQEDLAIGQKRVNAQIADSVRHALKEINKTSGYQIIFSNTGMDNILLAKDGYNITQKVIDLLNSRFKPEPQDN